MSQTTSSTASATCTVVPSNATFPILEGKTVLESAEFAKVPLDFGCRAGVCGTCYVNILRGAEHIPEPGTIEHDTLQKMNKLGQGRLACRIKGITGPLTIQKRS